jgi:hypothetical protein
MGVRVRAARGEGRTVHPHRPEEVEQKYALTVRMGSRTRR